MLDNIKLDFDDQNILKSTCESYYSNFHTHTNIVSIEYNNYRIYCPFKISCLRLEEMKQLEHITLYGENKFHGRLVDQDDITSFMGILSLPKLKHLDVFIENCTECLRFEGSVDETEKVNSFKSELENGTRFLKQYC